MAPMRVILLSCGCFDPPTIMHLRMFEIARDHLHSTGTHIVVGGVISPVHDSYSRRELTSSKHRLAMLNLALQNNDWIRLSTWECRQNEWTKTLRCLQYHQHLLNSLLCETDDVKSHIETEDLDWIPEDVRNNSDFGPIAIKLLCGNDLLETFTIPGVWAEEDVEAIVGLYGLVVITREESNANKFIYDSDTLSSHLFNIIIATNFFANASTSTNIRGALKQNESVKYFIEDSVIDYIHQHGIYSSKRTSIKEKDKVNQIVLDKLEAGFAKLAASDSKSLLKKYLTKDIFDQLKTKKTFFGCTLLDVIQSGVENLDSAVGIYAPDAESYTVFADLFDPIIEDYYGGFKKTDKHPPKDFGDVDTLGNLDPSGDYIEYTHVRCSRSLMGYPFSPCMTEVQYVEIEDKVSSTLIELENEFNGTFFPLSGMNKEIQQILIDNKFPFKKGDRFLQAANASRFWPTARGFYRNKAKTFLVFCNEKDHLQIISVQMGGDLGQVYRRLVTGINNIENRCSFSHNDRLGFLTSCPTNLGTTIRATVHIKVPKLAANKEKLEEIAAKFNLQVCDIRGEHTEAESGIYDISNKRRLGLTEYQAVKELHDGIAELIKIEKEL